MLYLLWQWHGCPPSFPQYGKVVYPHYKFSWGVSDRGASIRIPRDTAKNWKGYVEDRRPGSNADPYKIIKEIDISLNTTDQIYDVKIMMSKDVDMEGLNEKYGTISNDELLKEYREE